MNWIKKYKLLAIEALQFNKQLCIEISDLWQVLHLTFNSAQNHQINLELLDKIPTLLKTNWPLFSNKEFENTINNFNNLSTSRPD